MPASVRERELKFAVPQSFMLSDLTGDGLGILQVQDLPELDLRSTYYDTADLRLARSGVTLRYRTGEDSGPIWTLKLRVAGQVASVRDEHSFEGDPDTIPADAADLVAALARTEPLRPAATLRTRRRPWMLCGPSDVPLAELVDDEVSVLDGDRIVGRFRELELESRGPELEELRPIAKRLRRAGAVLAEPVSKAIRALGPRAAAPPDFADIPVGPQDPAGQAVRAALAAGLRRMVVNDAGTRLGDAEALHQMRVGARRLRSDLRTFAPLLDPPWAAGLGDELRWLGALLGEVRDLDVQMSRLEALAPDLLLALAPVTAAIAKRRDDARSSLLAGLRSERYPLLLDRLVDALRDPMLTHAAEQAARASLPRLLESAWRRLDRRASSLGPSDAEVRYHAVRIQAKRVRYAAEAIAPALGPRRARAAAVARQAADLQDLLGSLQDSVVAIETLEKVRGTVPANAQFEFAAGRLLERELAARRTVRDRFPKTWRRLARRYRRFARR